MTCRNKGISTVMPLATKNDGCSRLWKKLPYTASDSHASNFHERIRSSSGGKGGFFRGFHLGGRQDHDLVN